LNSTYNPDADSSFFLLVASSAHDSIIDSAYIDYAYPGIVFSVDGATLYKSRIGLNPFPRPITWGTDWATGDTTALFEGGGGSGMSVDETGGYFFLNAGWYPTLFALPGLQPMFIDSTGGSTGGVFIPGERRACYFTFAETHITLLDYTQFPADTVKTPMHTLADEPTNVHAVGSSLSGDSLFVIGSVDWEHCYFLILDADSLDIIAQIDIPMQYEYNCTPILMHPDGNRIFFYYPGSFSIDRDPIASPNVPGVVYELNLSSGTVSVLLDESDFGYNHLYDMQLTPDGKFLYISSAIWIAKINLVTGEKTQLFADRHLSCSSIAIRP